MIPATYPSKYAIKPAVADTVSNMGHRIQLRHTAILSIASSPRHRIIREAIETELHPNNMNREVASV
jgi:hypothetical protein